MLIYMLHISDIGQSVNALLRSGDCEGLHSVLQCRLRTFSVNKKKEESVLSVTQKYCKHNCTKLKTVEFFQQFHSVFLSPFLTGLDAFCDSYTVSCMKGVHHLQALTSLSSTDCCVLANPLRFLSELHFPVNWPFLQCWCLFGFYFCTRVALPNMYLVIQNVITTICCVIHQ